MKLAIFDLDNTLLAGDSDHAWGRFLISKGLVDAEHFARGNDHFYEQYKKGELDIDAYVAFAMEPLLAIDQPELERMHREFMRDYIRPLVLPQALDLVASHRAQGHYTLIITATNHFITSPVARLFQVDELLATELELCDGRYTGRIHGVPCYQEGKVERLRQWLAQKEKQQEARSEGHQVGPFTLPNSIFYSDSQNDLPLLQQAGEAVAVNPDPVLRQHAMNAGWKILNLRGDQQNQP